MAISENKSPIGIFGGTFYPVHFGHLRPSLEMCEALGMEKVRCFPSFIPPHRHVPAAPAELRLEMVRQAVSSEPRFIVDDREISRGGSSYMVDTLASLRKDFPRHPLCLLIGMDAFMQLHRWHQWLQLLDHAHIVVSQRPDSHFYEQAAWPTEIRQLYQQYKADGRNQLKSCLSGKILFERVTQLSISATDIRHRLKNNRSIRYLVPDTVLNLIECNHLYKS